MTPRQMTRVARTLVNLAARLTPDDDRTIAAEGRRLLDMAVGLYERAGEDVAAGRVREDVRKLRELVVRTKVRHRAGLGRQRPENWQEVGS